MKTIFNKDILFSYFTGNVSALQKKLIEEWLTQPENQEVYYRYLEEFEQLHPQFLPDTESAVERSLRRINSPEKPLRLPESLTPAPNRYAALKIACALFVVGLAVYYGYDRVRYRYYETSYGELRSFVLDDSSGVMLNANTVLKVPRFGFGVSDRQVRLTGEAEFHVKRRNDRMRFVVAAGKGNKVTVLGTEFVVYSRNHRTNVVLHKGKIQLTSPGATSPVPMEPGDFGSFSENGAVRIKKLTQTQLSDRLAWKQQRFAFDHTPLSRIAADIGDVFGLQVHIEDPGLGNREVTGSYKARTAEELLGVLSEMLEIEVIRKSETQILLRPGALPE